MSRAPTRAAELGLATLRRDGGFADMLSEMQTRAQLYELLDYSQYQLFDESVYNFDLTP